jgi:hypothetical protein
MGNDSEMLRFFSVCGFMVEAIAPAVMGANPNVEFEKILEVERLSALVDDLQVRCCSEILGPGNYWLHSVWLVNVSLVRLPSE